MNDRSRIKEVFTRYGYLDVEAMEPDDLDPILWDEYYIKFRLTGKSFTGGDEIRMVGCYTDIFDALMRFWNPYGNDMGQEAHDEMIEWMDDFHEF